jgi:uncharacterized membrane protein YidH (DUF202 family)
METTNAPDPDDPPRLDNLIFGEIQVLLAEKRTSMAALRTGIAVFALPLSVLSVLIATSRYYSMEKVMPLLLPLMILNVALIVLGSWLIYHAMVRLHHYDHQIKALVARYRELAEFVD